MARMIDAEELRKAFLNADPDCLNSKQGWVAFSEKQILKIIDAAPAIEAEPIVHAHWIDAKGRIINGVKMYVDGFYQCSACAKVTKEGKDFARCPNCGAHMDEAKVVE